MPREFWYSPLDMEGRLEDRRLLTGQGKFTSDWNFPDQAYAAFLRSDRAHAEIAGIDASAALAVVSQLPPVPAPVQVFARGKTPQRQTALYSAAPPRAPPALS